MMNQLEYKFIIFIKMSEPENESDEEVFETETERLYELFKSIRQFINDVPDFEEMDETIGIVEQKLIELENKYLKDIVKFVEIEYYDNVAMSVSMIQKNIRLSLENQRRTSLKNYWKLVNIYCRQIDVD